MAIKARTVTVTTSAVQLSSADTDAIYGQSLAVNNTGAVTVYLGDSSVATGTGYPLAAGAQIAIDLPAGSVPYAIAGSSTTVNVLEAGV